MKRIPINYDRVELLTQMPGGGKCFVAKVGIPPFRTLPDVLIWGDRYFQRSEGQSTGIDSLCVYVECFAYSVFPEHEQVQIQPSQTFPRLPPLSTCRTHDGVFECNKISDVKLSAEPTWLQHGALPTQKPPENQK